MSTKKALKSIQTKLGRGDQEDALSEATRLLKELDETSPEMSQVLMFRGLALMHLKQNEEAEKCYVHAYRLQPSNPLAVKGIPGMYQKTENWEKLGRFFESRVQESYNEGDADGCASALEELIKLREEHGPEDKLYATLNLLLPSSPLVSLLLSATPPTGSYTPFQAPEYPSKSLAEMPKLPQPLPHPLHLLGSLSLLLHLLIRSQVIVHTTIEAEVKARRQRLGSGPEKEVRKKVEAEVLGGLVGMGMVELLREVGGHPGVEDAVRRDVEVKEFNFWKKLVGVLSQEVSTETGKSGAKKAEDKSGFPPAPLFDPPEHSTPTKNEALTRANGLADGFILLGLTGTGVEEGWHWVLNGKDEPTIHYDLELLHKFAKTFPESPLTDFIDDYCRWFKLPLPEPEEPETEEAEDKVKEEKKVKKEKSQRWRRKPKGPNAKERRKARRQAGKEGVLAEDLDQEEKEELISSMTKLLDQLKSSVFAHRVMARILIQEEDWANAVPFAERGRVLAKEVEKDRGIQLKDAKLSLDTALAVALVPYFAPKHHSQATRLLKGVLDAQPTNSEARFARAQISQDAGKWPEARKNFQYILDQGGEEKGMVAAKEELGWCFVNEGDLTKGRDLLEEVVEVRDRRAGELEGKEDEEAFARARAWWRLGQTEWRIGDEESKEHAENWFMASMRALSTYAPAYSALGICYQSATPPDDERALKCFRKAFELDATEADAARLLATGYANDDEWAQVRLIANRVMEGEGGLDGVAGGQAMNPKGRFAPKNGWAWKALGATEMHYKNYTKAAQALQITLRAEPDDVATWTMLGESYVKAGRHTAGLKALEHVLELDPQNWMAFYHMADIRSQLGEFDKAIEAHEHILTITGDDQVGVTAALATAELAQGQQAAAGGFRERSRRAFHAALGLAHKVLQAGGHRPWAWKLVGDAAFELSALEAQVSDAQESSDALRPILEHLVSDDTDRRSAVEGLGHAANMLQTPVDLTHTSKSAIFAYAYRAHLLKNEPRVIDSALYDLAASLHSLALKSDVGAEIKTASTKAAISAIRLALERDAGDERLWNALGVLCEEGGAQLAQHAFVVSLELYQKDPVVWANLGYLYLRLDDRELANHCFLKAQTMDPDHATAWLGQAMLADRNGDKEHARGLFVHSVTLSGGSLLEADLAMAVATFEPFLSSSSGSRSTSVLHQPAFALRHYTHTRPTDSAAAHLYALICERLGLIGESVTALEKATELLEQEFETSESTEIEHRYTVALLNLGRVRLAGRVYDTSLEAFTNSFELLSGSQHPDAGRLRVQARLGQALAQYWLGQVDESLESFQHALDAAGGQGDKEVGAVLLARTLWGLGGDDAHDLAKSQLMECLSSENPSIQVISTLAAVAITSSDSDLIEATISELNTQSPETIYHNDPAGHSDLILFLNSLLTDESEESAIQILESAIISRPYDIVARNRLAKALIASGRYEDAGSALEGIGSADGEVLSESLRLRGVADIVGGGDDTIGMGLVQKSVVGRPWDAASWEALAWARKVQVDVE